MIVTSCRARARMRKASSYRGIAIGPVVGTLAAGLLYNSYGWRPVFFIFGAASLAWLIPWLLSPVPEKVNHHTPGPTVGCRASGT